MKPLIDVLILILVLVFSVMAFAGMLDEDKVVKWCLAILGIDFVVIVTLIILYL